MNSKTDKTAINSHLTGTSFDSEYDALFALLKAQPRVAAPTDFDFKLRARIARTELEPQGSLKQIEQLGLTHWVSWFLGKVVPFRSGAGRFGGNRTACCCLSAFHQS